MEKISSKKLFKVLVVVAFFGLLVFFNPEGFFDPIRIVLEKIAYPFKKFSYATSYKIDSTRDFIFSIGKLKSENVNLLKKNQELSAENAKLHDIERENNFLRQQIDILPRNEFDLEAAFVISQNPQGIGSSLEINKGSDSGIREGMAVIVSKGIMIGRVEKVFSDKSLVMLLASPKSALSVSVVQSGAKGLVRGEYGLGIIVDSILQADAVSVGNEIVTSGMSNEVPKGLLIGVVQEIKSSPDHLYRQAIVESPIDVSELEIVFVLKEEK